MQLKQHIQVNLRGVVVIAAIAAAMAMALVAGTHPVAALQDAGNTLRVSPVRSDIEVKPGTSKTVKVTVSNLTDGDITVQPIENDFVAGDERGTPALILDADKFAPTHSLKRFMAPLSNVTIPAHKNKTIDVKITVPASAQAGGYFGALRFAPASPAGGGQVNLNASVASLILLTVPGDAVEKLNLTNFDVNRSGQIASIFWNDGKHLSLATRFENKGNVQLGPFGKISVQRGNEVVYQTDFNTQTPHDVVLPDSARRWDIPLKHTDKFGRYTVSATFTYGKSNQSIDVKKTFWVITRTAMIVAGAILLGLIVLVVVVILFIRRHRRRTSHSRGGLGSGRRR